MSIDSNQLEVVSSLIAKRIGGEVFSFDQSALVFNTLLSDGLSQVQIASLLSAMAASGEAESELEGAAHAVRELREPITAPEKAIDIVGTGGDSSGSFNISSLSVIVSRAAGAIIAKHGNKAVSSKSGSANFYSELGIRSDLNPSQVQKLLNENNFAFFFAPTFHSAMKYAAPVRLELKARTIFNLIGPLVNPAKVKHYLIGVFNKKWMLPYARILKNMGANRAWVVHGFDGMDELSMCGDTHVVELKNGNISEFIINPADLGLRTCKIEDLKGGTAQENAQIAHEILSGKNNAIKDAVVYNSAAALYISEVVDDISTGLKLAENVILSGEASDFLAQFVKANSEI